MTDKWLDLAPVPEPLPAGKDWHVFLSYRSVNRPWVLALYDILNGLGYKVFLDQYVLTAASSLAVSLGEALDASQSAVMIWSGSSRDHAERPAGIPLRDRARGSVDDHRACRDEVVD
jgi:hypothetical protein